MNRNTGVRVLREIASDAASDPFNRQHAAAALIECGERDLGLAVLLDIARNPAVSDFKRRNAALSMVHFGERETGQEIIRHIPRRLRPVYGDHGGIAVG